MSLFRKHGGLWAVLLLAAGVRLYALDSHSAWLDEAETLQKTATLLEFLREKFHPPLHFLFLGFWRFLFGPDVWTARVFSVLMSLGGIALFYLLTLKLTQRRWAATLAALLLALAPWDLWQAREARMYSQWVFFFLLTCWGFVNLDRRNGVWLYLLGLLGGLGSHYYMGVYFVALLPCWVLCHGWGTLNPRTEMGRKFYAAHIPVALLGILYLSLHSVMDRGRYLRGMAWKFNGFSKNLIYSNLSAPGKLLLGDPNGLPDASVFWFSIVFYALCVFLLWGARRQPNRRLLWMVVWMALLPLLAINWVPIKSWRPVYYLPSLPMGILVMVVAMTYRSLPRYLGALAIALLVGMAWPATKRAIVQREITPWKKVCGDLKKNVGEQDVVLVGAPYMVAPLGVCYDGPMDMVPDRRISGRMNPRQVDRIQELIKHTSVAWFVQRHSHRTDPQGMIPRTLASRFPCVDNRSYHGVVVSRYRRECPK